MFTAKISKPNEASYTTKFIPNCEILNGIVVNRVNSKRVKVYYNSFLLEQNGISKEDAAKIINQGNKAEFAHPTLTKCAFVLGENEGGFLVESWEEAQAKAAEQQAQAIKAGQTPVTIQNGYFGYTINERLSPDVWTKLKPHASYHRGDDSDMEWAEDMGDYHLTKYDLKGWFYKVEAIAILLKNGIRVSYNGTELTSTTDIAAIDKSIKEAQQLAEQKASENKQAAQAEKAAKDAEKKAAYEALLQRLTAGLVSSTTYPREIIEGMEVVEEHNHLPNWMTNDGIIRVYEGNGQRFIIEYFGNASRVMAPQAQIDAWLAPIVEKAIANPSGSLVASILKSQGVKKSDGTEFTDYSRCIGCDHYRPILANPLLCEKVIDNYKANSLSSTPTEYELAHALSYQVSRDSSENEVLKLLGIYDETVAARIEKGKIIAEKLVLESAEALHFNMISVLGFGNAYVSKTEIYRSNYDIGFEELDKKGQLPALREQFLNRVRETFLANTLSEADRKKLLEGEKHTYIDGASDNSLNLFEKLLQEMCIWKQAKKALQMRRLEAIELNPHLTTEEKAERTAKLFVTDEQKKTQKYANFKTFDIPAEMLATLTKVEHGKELGKNEGSGHAFSLTESVLHHASGSMTAYIIEGAWWGGDEADEIGEIYADKDEALEEWQKWITPNI